MNRRILTIAWLALSMTCSVSAAEEIRWAPDLLTARKASAHFKVPLMVHFYGDNCLPCKMVEERVFPKPELIETLNKYFICVKVNGSRNPNIAAEYNVHAWPTDVFVAPDGSTLFSEVSKQDVNAYMATLHNVAVRNRDRNTMLAASTQTQPAQPTQQQMTQPQNRFASAPTQQPAQQTAYGQPPAQQYNGYGQQGQGSTGAMGGAATSSLASNRTPATNPAVQSSSNNFYAGRPQDTLAAHNAQQQIDRGMQMGPTTLNQQVHANTATTPGQSNNITGVMVPAHPSLLGQNQRQQPASNTAGQPNSALGGYQAMPTATRPAATNVVAANPTASANAQQWNASSSAAGQVIGNPYAQQQVAQTPQQSGGGAPDAVCAYSDELDEELATQRSNATNRFVGYQKPAPESMANSSTGASASATTPSTLPGGQAPAFEGYCVIEAKLGRWVPGKPEFAVKHRGKVYWLSSLEAQQGFMAEPDRAAPLLSGYDPHVFLTQGRLVEGSIEHTLHERISDQLLLFSSAEAKEAYFPGGDKDTFLRNTQTLLDILKQAANN